MSDGGALLKRYMDEANYYAELYGLNRKSSMEPGMLSGTLTPAPR